MNREAPNVHRKRAVKTCSSVGHKVRSVIEMQGWDFLFFSVASNVYLIFTSTKGNPCSCALFFRHIGAPTKKKAYQTHLFD